MCSLILCHYTSDIRNNCHYWTDVSGSLFFLRRKGKIKLHVLCCFCEDILVFSFSYICNSFHYILMSLNLNQPDGFCYAHNRWLKTITDLTLYFAVYTNMFTKFWVEALHAECSFCVWLSCETHVLCVLCALGDYSHLWHANTASGWRF